MVEFVNGKWTVTGPNGDILGRFDTREEAMKAMQAGQQTGGAGAPRPQPPQMPQAPQPPQPNGGMGFGQPQAQQMGGGLGMGSGMPQQQPQGGGNSGAIMALLKALLSGGMGGSGLGM